jgi:hypothetical protein
MVMASKKQHSLPAAGDDKSMDLGNALGDALYEDIRKQHGPILGGEDLSKALGYRSLAAFRQARRRGQVEVELFSLPNRRGVFALGLEVARWLVKVSQSKNSPSVQQNSMASSQKGADMPID